MTAITTAVLCVSMAAAAASVLASTSVDPRGPIEYPGMHATVDAHGAHVKGYTFQNRCRKPSPWHAKWIGPDDAGKTAAVMLFRREVRFADAPTKVDAWLSADCKYRLYINGRLVSRGPVDIGRDYAGGSTGRWFYDYRDLTPYFKKGANVIAAEVFREWPIGFTVSRGQPGFLFEAEAALPGGKRTAILSDTRWRSLPAPQYPDPSTYDASRDLGGWRLAGYDDSAWSACSIANNVWAPLEPSEIPPLMEARYPVLRIEGLPARTVTADTHFTVVFDRVLSAYPTIRVRGGRGATITIRAQQSATFVLGDGDQYFEFPYMTEVAPTFTVEVKNVTTPMEILDVGANFTSQPVEYRGAFACSDPQLNRLWDVSRWAVQICLQTHHLDSPNHQEPISDPGDYVIEGMVNNYAFAQPWLTRQDVRKFAWLLKDEKYHNFHTSYSIAWLQMLMDYYDYTGDRSLLVEMAPYVHELLDTYAGWRGRNGLISEAPNYMFMDWVTIGGFECHHPPAVIGQGYLTALYFHGLEMASRVAGLMGDKARAQNYARLREEITVAFNRELWAGDRGLYRDGKPFQTSVKPYQWLPPDKDIETFSPHVNLLAVLFDLAPKAKRQAIVEKVLAEQPLNTQPWFMHWVFQVIDHAGLFDRYGTQQMRRWKVVPETQSFREMWDSGDLSHGWCSTPLVQMASRVLGVKPLLPGFQTVAIQPQLCDLKWARGRVPSPHGDIAVSWTMDDGKFAMDVDVPVGCDAVVVLPAARIAHPAIQLDGRRAAAKVRVGSGKHRFEVSGDLAENRPPDLIPWPRNVASDSGRFVLTTNSRIIARSKDLDPLARLLSDEIFRVTGARLATGAEARSHGDLVLEIDPALKSETYSLDVGRSARILGGSYVGVAAGTTTLLQSLLSANNALILPLLHIRDEPAYPYRGALIDLGRKYHSQGGIEQVIELCRLYKIRFLHLHLADDQLFMFPSSHFPQLGKSTQEFVRFEPGSKAHIDPYTLRDLKHLEQFSKVRRVSLVPEIDLPGHSGRLIADAPDIFGIPGNGSTVNIANPRTLQALTVLLNEVMDVFQSTPYIHLGADEVGFGGLDQTADYRETQAKFGIRSVHDLYCKFVADMCAVVAKRGKRAIVWEEACNAEGPYPLPKDALVMVWSQEHDPNVLVKKGYTVVNASWTPLYIVRDNKKSLDVLSNWAAPQFGREGSADYTTLADTHNPRGAQLCSWENSESIEIQSMRDRLALVAERVWNPRADPSLPAFKSRLAHTDTVLDRLVHPIDLRVEGTTVRDENTFVAPITVTLTSRRPGMILKYTLDNSLPNANWQVYTGPIRLDRTAYLRAGLFDNRGMQQGYLVGGWFRAEIPMKPN